jgi:hypothetical protein
MPHNIRSVAINAVVAANRLPSAGPAAVGTIWGIMHSDRRKFDAGDDRIMDPLDSKAFAERLSKL